MAKAPDEHLRALAANLFAHMPADHDDARKVMEHMRSPAEWQETGVRVDLVVSKSTDIIQFRR